MTIESMNRNITIIALAWISFSCTGITVTNSVVPNILNIKGHDFEGIILTAGYIMPQPSDTIINRFTPTREEIEFLEKIIEDSIKYLNRDRLNQDNSNPVIDENLHKYFRQYVGFLDANGNKIIFVNMLWNRWSLRDRFKGFADPREGLHDGFVQVFDGGSRYWQIKVNITLKVIAEFSVNGNG
ncbi:hypothetical protein JNM05_16535 [bacterium]|nr:hypothetical protein [bacterium]